MKNKKILLLALLSVIVLLFVPCTNHQIDEGKQGRPALPGEPSEPEEFVKGFIIDNSKPLSEIISHEYSLKELTDFFDGRTMNDYLTFCVDPESCSELSIEEVDAGFPVECLRKNNLTVYSVYKVSEGGYFYVFWGISVASRINENGVATVVSLDPIDAHVDMALHISSLEVLKSASDFDSIKEGISTAQDVALIDPAFQLNPLYSSCLPSFTFLNDRTVMRICYDRNTDRSSLSDLTVVSKEIVSEEHSPLGSVLLRDLP